MNELNLKKNQYVVIKAEFTTGIVLRNDGFYFKSGDDCNEKYNVFENFDDAKNFASNEVQNNKNVECWIQNYKSEMIFLIDKNGEQKI